MSKKPVKPTPAAHAQGHTAPGRPPELEAPVQPADPPHPLRKPVVPDHPPSDEVQLPIEGIQTLSEEPTKAVPDGTGAGNAPSMAPGSISLESHPDAADREIHTLIYKMETLATKGHGMDQDRAALKEGAGCIRMLMGLGPEDQLLYPLQGPSV